MSSAVWRIVRSARPRRSVPFSENVTRGTFKRPCLSRASLDFPGKYFRTVSTGFGAAWPSPQIEASIIACESSCSSGLSHSFDFIKCSAFSVPTRHGVHWPHDSSAKNFITLRAAAGALSWSDKHDDCRRADEAAVRCQRIEVERHVASDAGRMPPDAPPGR